VHHDLVGRDGKGFAVARRNRLDLDSSRSDLLAWSGFCISDRVSRLESAGFDGTRVEKRRGGVRLLRWAIHLLLISITYVWNSTPPVMANTAGCGQNSNVPSHLTSSSFSKADGDFVRKWGVKGDDDGQFVYPFGVALAQSMCTYATLVAIAGKHFRRLGPYGVAVDSERVYTSDTRNNRLQVFR
jgi:hypothetical protein